MQSPPSKFLQAPRARCPAERLPNPVGALTITNAGGDISLKLQVSRAPAHYTMLLGTAPCSRGLSRPRRFTLLGALPDPEAGVCDITGQYVAKYGIPPVGTRVFICTRQIANGWEDLQKDTPAVVPAASQNNGAD